MALKTHLVIGAKKAAPSGGRFGALALEGSVVGIVAGQGGRSRSARSDGGGSDATRHRAG